MAAGPVHPSASRIAVIGAGNWGTALALVAARNIHSVALWARDDLTARAINQSHRNPRHLSAFDLPANITATSSLQEAITGAEIIILAAPSHALREMLLNARPLLMAEPIVVSAVKGIENVTLLRMSEVVADVLGKPFEERFVALSGPSFALEVAKGDPTALVAAGRDRESRERVQRELSSASFRIYTNEDVIGVELGGAVKNVVAIAAGVVRGLGYGSNSVAAIITRGLAEMTRLAVACGGKAETMAGLAGLGDLVLTCTGELSRNRKVGVELGRGRRLDDILADMNEVAEGVKTTRAVFDLAARLKVDMPITAGIHALLYENKPATEAAAELMERPLKQE
jgi:glycerol-3-phosphate dehydrogenase (NAD(P)+)